MDWDLANVCSELDSRKYIRDKEPSDVEPAGTSSSVQGVSSRALPTVTGTRAPSRMGVDTSKAGMEGLDKEKIDLVILQASAGSKFYKNEMRKEKQLLARVDEMARKLRSTTPSQQAAHVRAADGELAALEKLRDLSRIIVHVDMDAFYAAVEMRDNPALRDVPMAVGGMGMLSTSNYPARRFGVRAAMPGFIGKKLCPDLVIVEPNFDKYRSVSDQVHQILEVYDPDFCPMGLDESYLDLTNYVASRMTKASSDDPCVTAPTCSTAPASREKPINADVGTRDAVEHSARLATGSQTNSPSPEYPSLPWEYWECAKGVVTEIRQLICERTGLTASAGIATNTMLAKIASDMNKPNGQCFVEPTKEAILHFVHLLPVRKISGIGKVTGRMLGALGITTCRELFEKRGLLPVVFSKTLCSFFFRVALGIGSVEVNREHHRQSISTERTFAAISDPALLQAKCLNLCQALMEDITQEGVRGKTVTLKMKTDTFEVRSRAATLTRPVTTLEQLYKMASELLASEVSAQHPKPLTLRLMGVRVSCLDGIKGTYGTLDKLLKNTGTVVTMEIDDHPYAKDCDIMEGAFGCHGDPDRDTSVECPVCRHIVTGDNTAVNQHMDICLNTAAIHVLQTWANSENSHDGPTTELVSDEVDMQVMQRRASPNDPQTPHQPYALKKRSSDNACLIAAKRHRCATLEHFWPKSSC